jgi:cytochrome c-L
MSDESIREASLMRLRQPLLAAFLVCLNLAPVTAAIEFKNVFSEEPLDLTPGPDETITEAVKQFQETGVNPYDGDAEAIAAGKELYNANCQVCHGASGEGRMGVSLIDDKLAYLRVATDAGMFEAIYGGAAGAMRPFKGRLTQDQILHVIAYVRSLKK